MGYTHEKMLSAFFVTAGWDVVLRQFSEKRIRFMGIENWKWVKTLEPYFEKHTLLAAALIAGFVGAIAYSIITSFDLPRFQYYVWVALVSALIGIPMRYSKLFPHLETHYYKPLGFWYSMCTDAFSGLVVCFTMEILAAVGNAIASA